MSHLHAGRLIAPLLLLTAVACRPDYPNCEDDDDCRGGVCVNRQCQQCLDDSQCAVPGAAGPTCVSGRCEQVAAKATPAGCTSSADCQSGQRCDGQTCVAGCAGDLDCGPEHTCTDGACVRRLATHTVSAGCRSMTDPASGTVAVPPIHFEFNRDELTPEAQRTLDEAAPCLREATAMVLVIEGHGDERGTQEYNLALGEKRAQRVRGYLGHLGVDVDRLRTLSKGENEPVCSAAVESCWSQNRRVEVGTGRM